MPAKFTKKVFKSKNTQFSYWSNGVKNPLNIYILLAPGASGGGFFKNIIKLFPKNNLIISFDYPGRGSSIPISDNSIYSISKEVLNYIKCLKLIKKPYLVGLSYGTAVATELVKIDSSIFKELILVAPGEFIDKKYHFIIKLIFLPAKFSENIRKFYRAVLVKYLSSVFKTFPKKNLKSILYQWLGIIEYNLDTNFTCKLPCTILAYSHDQLIRKGSILKVKKIFPNSIIFLEVSDHNLNINYISKRLLIDLFKLQNKHL